MSEEKQNIFRQKTIDRISSPEHLTEYLHVTNPGIWAVLAAVILLLAGILAWSMVGTLETAVPARIIVADHLALINLEGDKAVAAGMPLRAASQEYTITDVQTDEFGRTMGVAEVTLPDGTYDGTVITETVHPISFLLESR